MNPLILTVFENSRTLFWDFIEFLLYIIQIVYTTQRWNYSDSYWRILITFSS